MKKLFLLFTASLIAGGVQAQTPVKAQRGMVTKISATWCGPCGAWGWTLASDLKDATHDKAFYVGVFDDDNTSWATIDFYSKTAELWAGKFFGGGWPSFAANAVDKSAQNTSSGVNVAGVKADVIAAIDAHHAEPTIASTGYWFTKTATKVTATTKTKFWAAANGTYFLGAYMVEDEAPHSQNGQTSQTGKVAHTNVLRGSMSNNGNNAWGEQIATGSIAANAEFTKTFEFDIPTSGDPDWTKVNMAKLKVVTILWKQNGTSYEYVNGNDIFEFPASVPEFTNMANLVVYPNPAIDQAFLNVTLRNPAAVNVVVTDAMGRTVHTSGSLQFNSGMNGYAIPTSNLASGLYNVTISSEDGVMTQRLSVAK